MYMRSPSTCVICVMFTRSTDVNFAFSGRLLLIRVLVAVVLNTKNDRPWGCERNANVATFVCCVVWTCEAGIPYAHLRAPLLWW
jgi:hypothetical protein